MIILKLNFEKLMKFIIGWYFRCLLDSDDEVRDRATFYVSVLKQKQKSLNLAYILNGKFVPTLG